MRGYLQRLAVGVMQPVRSIHPLVGSVFSPPEYATARTAPTQGETLFSSSGPGSDFAFGREKAGDLSSIGQHQPHVTSSTQELNSFSDPQPVYRPFMPEVNDQAAGRQPQPTTQQTKNPFSVREEEAPSSPANDAGAERTREADAFRDERPQEVIVRHAYTPIISGGLSANQQTPGQNANPFATAARERPQVAPRHAATVSREPDEIQIHIGRIEVTAVQQTYAQTATKPVRKGMNLDEYLRRSDRRV